MKYALLALGLMAAASVATYARYESLDPCVWMEQDMAKQSGLPRLVVRTQMRARFLLDGVTDPTLYQCLSGWWQVRRDGLPDES